MSRRNEWIKWLETASLPQTCGELHRPMTSICEHTGSEQPMGYCCLGIGLKMLGYDDTSFSYIANFSTFATNKGFDSQDLYDALDINYEIENMLADLNDKAKLSFKQIAKLLREGNAAIAAKHRELCGVTDVIQS